MSDLVSLQEAENFLGEGTFVSGYHLQTWISGLSAFIRRYIDAPIETDTFTETLDGSGGTTVVLSNRPVLSVTSVTVDDDAVDLSDVAFYDYGELYSEGGFPAGRQNVSVEYTAGHGDDVPADLKLATLLILEQAAQTSLLQQSTRGEYAYVFAPTKWPKDARDIVESYRKRL